VRKAVDAAVVKNLLIFCVLLSGLYATAASAQDLPADELQVNLSGYFDSFNVNVIYPNISLTRHVSETTSLTGRYLVDMITAASIRSGSGNGGESEDEHEGFENEFDKRQKTTGTNQVDAVTAASAVGGSQEGISFDDVRHEFNLGMTHLLAGNRFSLNGIYSTERDYTSALKNTTLEIGFVRSWDHVFPVTKDWTRKKNVITYSLNFSQVLSKNALIQILTSYTENNGYLADAYNQIKIGPSDSPVLYDPIHPDNRIRRAAGAELKYRLNATSSLQTGYRYYWDSWDVISHTISASYMTYLSPHVIFDVGLRHYLQSRAFFFKPEYLKPEFLMTVDVKLDKGYSNELQLELILNGGRGLDYLPYLMDEHVQYNFSLNLYQRYTETGYWFNGNKNLIAANFNIGIRYRF
jgi:hypothetical protein